MWLSFNHGPEKEVRSRAGIKEANSCLSGKKRREHDERCRLCNRSNYSVPSGLGGKVVTAPATAVQGGKLLWHRVSYYLLNFILLENGKSFTRFSVTLNTEKKLLRGKTSTRDTKPKQETEMLSKRDKT